MQVTMRFNSESEADGFQGSTTVVRYNVDDLYSLGRAYADAARAAGYTYVEDVGFEKDDGSMVFGDF